MELTYTDPLTGKQVPNQIERTLFRVVVGELDVTRTLRPILHALHISNRAGQTTDSCDITLDDTNGRLVMPPANAPMQVWIGNRDGQLVQMFDGHVDEIRSRATKTEGRILTITAKGMDTSGSAKAPVEAHYDNASLQQVLTEAAAKAGISQVVIDPALGAITRPYWAQQNESLIHFGQRIAREVGGTFKIAGSRVVMAKRGGGTSATGKTLTTVQAAWGVNLISWDIAPVMTRGRYTAARGRYYDPKKGKYAGREHAVKNATATATHVTRHTHADGDEADQHATADAEASDRQSGMGTVRIDGEVYAQPEALCTVAGTRPGIDGHLPDRRHHA